jgi:choline transport protein
MGAQAEILVKAVHMSEEVRDARRSVPRTMITVWIINFIILFVAAITVCYHITDTEEALNDPTTYPAIYVLRQALPLAWITVILVMIVVLNVASNIVYLATVTRDLFAFARDKGLPFSNWLSYVNTRRHIPQNAAITSCVFAVLLAVIYIGSPVAFYAMTSLATVSLLQCYGLSIGCHLWRRIYHPETLPPAYFPLGRFGVPLNVMSIIYCTYGFFWAFWPTSTPVTAEGFNWYVRSVTFG